MTLKEILASLTKDRQEAIEKRLQELIREVKNGLR